MDGEAKDTSFDQTHVGGAQRLANSHAHEDVPGTVNMNAKEGDETAYGLALYPVPAQNPNDPLQWSPLKKNTILIVACAYSFLSSCALLGPAVYINLFAEQWKISPVQASGLISYPNLAFGFGTLLLVPLYHKFGRRPVMLLSLVIYAAGLIGASQATSYAGLMTARVFHAFGSSVCEALPAQLVNDIFFLHERGKRLGYYTVALCLGATGPLYAGYMLAGGYSWQLFFYVHFAFALVLLVVAFLFVEESMYSRPAALSRPSASSTSSIGFELEDTLVIRSHGGKADRAGEQDVTSQSPTSRQPDRIPERLSFLQTLRPWSKYDKDSDFWLMMVRAWSYFVVPPVFWVCTTYGLYIGLAGLVFNYTFPIKITAPPYNWTPASSGLISVGTAVGYLLAMPFVSTSDRLAAHYTRKNGGIREAEFRLGVLLAPCIVAPVGLIVYGLAAARDLHWFAYFAGVALVQWAAYFYFTLTLAYAVDSYSSNVPEMLIAMNIGKQAISFGIGLYVLDWVMLRGYAVVIAGVFCVVLLVNNLAVLGFIGWGKRMRVWFAATWLARMHRRSIREVVTH